MLWADIWSNANSWYFECSLIIEIIAHAKLSGFAVIAATYRAHSSTVPCKAALSVIKPAHTKPQRTEHNVHNLVLWPVSHSRMRWCGVRRPTRRETFYQLTPNVHLKKTMNFYAHSVAWWVCTLCMMPRTSLWTCACTLYMDVHYVQYIICVCGMWHKRAARDLLVFFVCVYPLMPFKWSESEAVHTRRATKNDH